MENQSGEQGTIRYIRCPSCGAPNPASAANCSGCSKPLAGSSRPAPAQAAHSITCPKCQNSLPAGSKFCGYCGAPLSAPSPQPWAPAAKPGATLQPPPSTTPAQKPKTTPQVAAGASGPVVSKPAAAQPAPPPQETVAFPRPSPPKIEASLSEVKQDGSAGRTIPITKEIFIGCGNCDASYPGDHLLSPRHASLAVRQGKLTLKDLESQNGSFVKLRLETELKPGDVFLLGRELFRFATRTLGEAQEDPSSEATTAITERLKPQRRPSTAKLEHIQLTGEVIEEFTLDKPETSLGRTNADLVFKNDPYMSGTHARIVAKPGRFVLQDLKSTNGIYRRIRGEAELADGDEFFVGEQRFRVAIKAS